MRWVEILDAHCCNLQYLSDSVGEISKVRSRDTYGDFDMRDVCVVEIENCQVVHCATWKNVMTGCRLVWCETVADIGPWLTVIWNV